MVKIITICRQPCDTISVEHNAAELKAVLVFNNLSILCWAWCSNCKTRSSVKKLIRLISLHYFTLLQRVVQCLTQH